MSNNINNVRWVNWRKTCLQYVHRNKCTVHCWYNLLWFLQQLILPMSLKITSLALGQWYNFPGVSEATLHNIGKMVTRNENITTTAQDHLRISWDTVYLAFISWLDVDTRWNHGTQCTWNYPWYIICHYHKSYSHARVWHIEAWTQMSFLPMKFVYTNSESTEVCSPGSYWQYDVSIESGHRLVSHHDVIKWERFPRYCPFAWNPTVTGDTPHKGFPS